MNRHLIVSRWLITALVLAVTSFAVTRLATAAPAQRTLQQAPSCSWTKIGGNLPQQTFHAASAYDSKKNHIYIYGGLDRNNSVLNTVQKVDVSTAGSATSSRVTASGALQRYGAAGAFRPEGDSGKIYWIGGADTDGEGSNDIQIMNLADGSMSKSNIGGGLNRVFHAAAYDPEHDVIVVHGGAKTCVLVGRTPPPTPTPRPTAVANGGVVAPDGTEKVQQTAPCQGESANRTQYLKFATDGSLSWILGPAGGPSQIFGLSLSYDPLGKRMLAFGGTTSETANPSRDVWALDLSDPDLSKADWKKITAGGSAPAARSFHSASFDAGHNWLVINGGVAADLFKTTENVRTDTFALNLGGASPMWVDLKTSAGDRMGGTGAYAVPDMGVTTSGGRKQYKFTGGQNTVSDTSLLKCSVVTPTNTPVVGPTNPRPTPTSGGGGPTNVPPTIDASVKICDQIKNRVPAAAINAMAAKTPPMKGCNSSLPIGPNNGIRTYISLENISKPYHPLFNGLTFKCGCP